MSNRLLEITTSTELITETCFKCHVLFAMPKDMQERCHKLGDTFYCPNGHGQVYCESEVTRLQHLLNDREAALERARSRLNGALEEIASKKQEITRIKKRVHNGVCPECHRYFANLNRHMKTKHAVGDKL